MKKRKQTPTVPSGEPTPAALNKMIQQKAADYVAHLNESVGPLPERMRKMLAQPGFLFKRQAE